MGGHMIVDQKDIHSSNNEINKDDFDIMLANFRDNFKLDENLPIRKINAFFNSPFISHVSNEVIKQMFLSLDVSIQDKLLDNFNICHLILSLPANKNNRTCFDIVKDNIKIKILNYGTNLNKIAPNLFESLLTTLKEPLFSIYTPKISPDYTSQNEEAILYIICGKYKVEESIAKDFIAKAKIGLVNYFNIYKIKSREEFLFYAKFEIRVDFKTIDNKAVLANDTSLQYDFLYRIKASHLKKIVKKVSSINNEHRHSNENILDIACKLYCTFGFDNAMSILNNKFTQMTEAALKRIAKANFINTRRTYRLTHQNKFFSHSMVTDTISAVRNNNFDYFRTVCVDNSDNYVISIINELKENIENFICDDDIYKYVSDYMKGEVIKRERYIEKKAIQSYIDNYISKNKLKKQVAIDDLKKLTCCIDISKTNFDKNGNPIIDEAFSTFMLGNIKNDNDALLRLIFNDQALGLNKTVHLFINNFSLIKSIVAGSNDKLSLYSIIDIMEISKVLFFKLAPDEQDIPITVLSKIITSNDFCSLSQEKRIEKTKEVFFNQKNRVYSSIPYVKGISKDGVRYSTNIYDNPNVLAYGIDVGNCFKVGGTAEDFFLYCLTSPHGSVIEIYDEDKFYICPIVRNGNTVYGNGIDPVPKDLESTERVVSALQECLKKLCTLSDKKDKIELGTVTNLHLEKFFKNKNFKTIKVSNNLGIDAKFYCDLHKDELTHYVLTGNSDINTNTYYEPSALYQQPRMLDYSYQIANEIDKEQIEIQINSIYYHSINFRKTSQSQRNSDKRNYVNLSIDDFSYVIGNKDWFIAISPNNSIISACLPYDKRAQTDYFNALANIKNKYMPCMERDDFKR